jgi:hypothetical protein
MSYKIGLWAGAGFLVAAGWAVYAFLTQPPALTALDPILPLVQITCPIAYLSLHFNFGVSLYGCLAANAVTYALIGIAFEALRGKYRPPRVA